MMLLAASACVSSANKSHTNPTSDEFVAAKMAASSRVEAQLADYTSGDLEAFVSYFAPDVMWFGTSALGAIVGRDAVAAHLVQLRASPTTEIVRGPAGVADDGRAVWAMHELIRTDEIDDEHEQEVRFLVTSLVAEDDGVWWIVAQHWSVETSNTTAFQMAASGSWPPLAEIGDSASGAGNLVAVFKRQIVDSAAWLASYSDRDDTLALGGALEQRVAGGTTIKAVLRRSMESHRVEIAVHGGIRAGVVASGTAAWLATNLDFRMTTPNGTVTQPYRALVVFLKEGGAWRMVQTHFSNGMPQGREDPPAGVPGK